MLMDSQQEICLITEQPPFYKLGKNMKRSRLFIVALTLLFVGCSPTQSIIEWKSNPEHRGFVSTRMAKAVMEIPVIDEDEEDEVEELCDGSGWIVHGDGHKTPCPGCEACEKQVVESVGIIVDVVEDCPDGKCPAPSSQSQPKRRGLLKRIFGR